MGTVSGYNCYRKVGDTIYHESGTEGVLQPNGDIEWSHGYTTRLWNPCQRRRKNPRHQECKATPQDILGMRGTTISSWDPY